MIELHRLDGKLVVVNSDLVEFVEPVPDTVITLVSGNKFIVRESVQDVRRLVTAFRQSINQPPSPQAAAAPI